jgi:hypothetical protein
MPPSIRKVPGDLYPSRYRCHAGAGISRHRSRPRQASRHQPRSNRGSIYFAAIVVFCDYVIDNRAVSQYITGHGKAIQVTRLRRQAQPHCARDAEDPRLWHPQDAQQAGLQSGEGQAGGGVMSYNERRTDEARQKLRTTLSQFIVLNNVGDLLDAIDEYVEAKLESRLDDFRDEINKRGVYDPDY